MITGIILLMMVLFGGMVYTFTEGIKLAVKTRREEKIRVRKEKFDQMISITTLK